MFKFKKLLFSNYLSKGLKEYDSEVYKIMKNELIRQQNNINLTASDNFASNSILEALGSHMQNKYSEGYIGSRLYGGTQHIDEMEKLCMDRALKAFNVNEEDWGVNVQSLSGSPANMYSYSSVCNVNDYIVALEPKYGGHLSHGVNIQDKFSHSSKFYNFIHFSSKNFNEIDFDEVEELVSKYKPKILLAGYSFFTKFLNYEKFRNIAHKNNALLMADMSHISGMVSAQLVKSNPFDFCDIITTTTHKCLRGPRSSLIFYNKKNQLYPDLEKRINESVFPGHQGGPHNHTISALSVALRHCKTEEFVQYQKNIIKNSIHLAKCLSKLGIELLGGGTENHMIMINLKNQNIDASRVDYLSNKLNISFNIRVIPDNKPTTIPYGIRIGTPAMTTRNLNEKDFETVAEILLQTIKLAKKNNIDNSNIDNYKNHIDKIINTDIEIIQLNERIQTFLKKFPLHYKFN